MDQCCASSINNGSIWLTNLHHASKLWLSPVHHGSMLWIHNSLHDVHQASVWHNAVHQVSIWLNDAVHHGINYSSMLCTRHQCGCASSTNSYSLMLCIHGSMMCIRYLMLCIRHQYGAIWLNAVHQASSWHNIAQC